MGLFSWLGNFFDEATAPKREHKARMTAAAGISSVQLRCHADTWSRINGEMWNNAPKVPADRVVSSDRDLVEVTLSGPHLVTLVQITSPDHPQITNERRALARRVYQEISKVLDAVDPDAQTTTEIPPIVLDDRLSTDAHSVQPDGGTS